MQPGDTLSTLSGRSFDELRFSERLPSPSGLALSLLGLSRDGEDVVASILEHVRADAVLTGRLLKLANATRAADAPPRLTATSAAADLDPAVVRNLALGFHLVPRSAAEACEGFDHDRHWLLSLATAASAEALSRSFRSGDPDAAFTIGLVCRVGRLAMANLHPEAYAKVLREAAKLPEREQLEVEQREFRTDRWQVAADLMEDWGFPHAAQEQVLCLSRGAAGSREDDGTIRTSSLLKLAVEMGEAIVAREPEASFAGEGALARDRAEARWRELADLCGLGALARGTDASATGETTAETTPAAPRAETKAETQILVVDDEPGMRHLLGAHLKRAGYDVLFATDGEAGLAAVLSEAPEIVITDWMMPKLSGVEMCKALRKTEIGRMLHVVLLTSLEEEDQIVEGLEAGANDFLTKPFNPRILLARVRAGERMVALQRQVEQSQQVDRKRMAQMAQLTRQLRNTAMMDALTGLSNRRFAMAKLEETWAFAKRSGHPLSVVMIDIDHFKRVNDRHGHQAGDAVLRAVAKVLKKQVRRGDHLCRIGGEEFLLIAANADVEAAAAGAERLRAAVEGTKIECAGFEGRVTISLGVAGLTKDMERVDDLIRAADQGVYLAKDEGRNCARVWEPPKGRALSA